jgi:hypothetical protein
MFPQSVRSAVAEDAAFRHRFALDVDAVVTLRQTAAEFVRSKLFHAVRQVLAGTAAGLDVKSKDGLVWRVAIDVVRGIVVLREGTEVSIPEFTCMSPYVNVRLEWFERESTACRVADERMNTWRDILAERPLEDDEVGRLLEDFSLTPVCHASSIRRCLRSGNCEASDLVPSDLRYFDRLVGALTDETDVQGFTSSAAQQARVRALVGLNPLEGLRAALLCHHSLLDVVEEVPRDVVLHLFRWLAEQGDRTSQVAAIECGLRLLPMFPEIEESLAAMVRAIAADEPNDENGRPKLMSGLIVLVEGELARTGIARKRPPFWRRLASMAHAAVIEREVLAANLKTSAIAERAHASGWTLYRKQTLVDLRREPRWFPDFISPEQLKAELVGRIAGAAERARENVADGELSAALWGADPGTIESQKTFPFAFLPGPLEGGVEAVIDIPSELESSIRMNLQAVELTPKSFFGLVNASMIFRVNSQLSELAAQGLRRVGYQLRKVETSDDTVALLEGLAMVCAVTRSRTLADEVRVLARGARRRRGSTFTPRAIARIGLIAAAANKDLRAWSDFVGEWLTELAFADMTREQAVELYEDIYILCHLERSLWETCGRAEAATAAFVESFPNSGDATQNEPGDAQQ